MLHSWVSHFHGTSHSRLTPVFSCLQLVCSFLHCKHHTDSVSPQRSLPLIFFLSPASFLAQYFFIVWNITHWACLQFLWKPWKFGNWYFRPTKHVYTHACPFHHSSHTEIMPRSIAFIHVLQTSNLGLFYCIMYMVYYEGFTSLTIVAMHPHFISLHLLLIYSLCLLFIFLLCVHYEWLSQPNFKESYGTCFNSIYIMNNQPQKCL